MRSAMWFLSSAACLLASRGMLICFPFHRGFLMLILFRLAVLVCGFFIGGSAYDHFAYFLGAVNCCTPFVF
jgi:hypothetical protein